MTGITPEVIETERLVLVPLDDEVAEHIIGGDPSCLDHVAGWPHADTIDAVRLRAHGASVWLVGLDGVVIGDCGTLGPAQNGAVEIGFGLAEERRGRGYGTELVVALSDWLLVQAGITSVVGTTDVSNAASRHVLERTGFEPAAAREGLIRYIRVRTV
jgi:[ribosomal protein S5]-alanine N-acetyltransferase